MFEEVSLAIASADIRLDGYDMVSQDISNMFETGRQKSSFRARAQDLGFESQDMLEG